MAGRRDLTSVLRHLYGLEINCGLGSFFDQGWNVWIGDEMNGRKASAWCDTTEDAARWLRAEAALVILSWRRYRRAERRRAELKVAE